MAYTSAIARHDRASWHSARLVSFLELGHTQEMPALPGARHNPQLRHAWRARLSLQVPGPVLAAPVTNT